MVKTKPLPIINKFQFTELQPQLLFYVYRSYRSNKTCLDVPGVRLCVKLLIEKVFNIFNLLPAKISDLAKQYPSIVTPAIFILKLGKGCGLV